METIFLSHSSKDEPLARLLFALLNLFICENRLLNSYKIFFAPESLRCERGTPDWKLNIQQAVKRCSSCVVLLTPQSIENRWVNYELGLATAHKKKIIPVGVAGINFNLVIINNIQTIFLHEFSGISALLKELFGATYDEQIDAWLSKPEAITQIYRLNYHAQVKTVYLVGSEPSSGDLQCWQNKEVDDFVVSLSNQLLEHDFRLASFPSVEHIGKLVAACALEKNPEQYEIAGLYKFDYMTDGILKDLNINNSGWDKIIEAFRKVYLSGKDSMIIIGGGENTKNEYDVAKKISTLQIFPIPCFGGFAVKAFNEMKEMKYFADFKHPCLYCNGKGVGRKCPKIPAFVKRLQEIKVQIQ